MSSQQAGVRQYQGFCHTRLFPLSSLNSSGGSGSGPWHCGFIQSKSHRNIAVRAGQQPCNLVASTLRPFLSQTFSLSLPKAAQALAILWSTLSLIRPFLARVLLRYVNLSIAFSVSPFTVMHSSEYSSQVVVFG